MQKPLTVKQRAVLDFISDTIRDKGYAPSLQETGAHFGLTSLATVHKHVTNLQEKGYLTRRWGHSRSITLLAEGDCCPTCGQKMPAAEIAEAV